jgi:hypothetical protein
MEDIFQNRNPVGYVDRFSKIVSRFSHLKTVFQKMLIKYLLVKTQANQLVSSTFINIAKWLVFVCLFVCLFEFASL